MDPEANKAEQERIKARVAAGEALEGDWERLQELRDDMLEASVRGMSAATDILREDAVQEAFQQARDTGGPWPEPSEEEPDQDEVEDMLMGSENARATDGCEGIEADGCCQHGHPSWPVHLGMI